METEEKELKSTRTPSSKDVLFKVKDAQATYLGQQLIVELHDCSTDLLSDPNGIETMMKGAAQKMGATIVTSNFHHFSPLGVSGVVVIMESHLTIHTWPEFGYAAVDIFTCGKIDLEAGVQFLEETLAAKKTERRLILRGENVKK